MKTVYLCGAINGQSDEACKGWRDEAKAALAGQYTVLDPMRRDFRGKEAGNAGKIIRGDLTDIHAADILLVNASRPSWGTAMEVYHAASSRRCLVYAFGAGDHPSPWLVAHCDQLFPDLAAALTVLRGAA